MTIHLYKNDLPNNFSIDGDLAIDTETMGLNLTRDRLCVLQMSNGGGEAHLIQFDGKDYTAPNLKKILANQNIEKIFHFARFDVAVIQKYLNVECTPIFCTRTASKMIRTYTDRHGLKDVCRELLGVEISKQQQSSDWGAETLTKDQQQYAANDVLYLHALRETLTNILHRENRTDLAKRTFDAIITRAHLDLAGWPDIDFFAH